MAFNVLQKVDNQLKLSTAINSSQTALGSALGFNIQLQPLTELFNKTIA